MSQDARASTVDAGCRRSHAKTDGRQAVEMDWQIFSIRLRADAAFYGYTKNADMIETPPFFRARSLRSWRLSKAAATHLRCI
jgi:hypothetical protein